jgi:hypothetical protein
LTKVPQIRFSVNIPVFGERGFIYAGVPKKEVYKEMREKFGFTSDDSDNADGFFVRDYSPVLGQTIWAIWIMEHKKDVLIHEITHLLMVMLHVRQFRFSWDSQENWSYWMAYLFEQIYIPWENKLKKYGKNSTSRNHGKRKARKAANR